AAVVWNRRGVANRAHFNTSGRQCTDGGLTSGTWAADTDFNGAHTVVARHIGGVHGGLLCGEGSSFTRSTETQRTGTLPGKHIPRRIGDSHDRVVERCLDVRHAVGHVFTFFLLERFLLAFFVGRSGAGCCWFCHCVCPFVVGLWPLAKTLRQCLAKPPNNSRQSLAKDQRQVLRLGRSLFLGGNRALAWTLPGARIGVGALPPNRQVT